MSAISLQPIGQVHNEAKAPRDEDWGGRPRVPEWMDRLMAGYF